MATGGQVSKVVGAGRLASTTDSIQIACRGVTGVTYTDIDTLAANCLPVLIDETGTSTGTRNVTPTKLTDFRGYPKPEITMNYETVPVTTGFITKEYLAADLPSLNHSVGFQTIFTASVVERQNSSGGSLLSSHSKTFTYNGGSGTTNKPPNSSTATELSSGVYQLSYSDPTASYDVWVQVTITADTGFYIVESNPFTATMTYEDTTPNSFTIYASTGGSLPCAITYNAGSPITVYTSASVLGPGVELFTNTGLTSEISNGTYVLDPAQSEGTKYDTFFYNGAIQYYNVCDL